eukprot:EG_transcript_16186
MGMNFLNKVVAIAHSCSSRKFSASAWRATQSALPQSFWKGGCHPLPQVDNNTVLHCFFGPDIPLPDGHAFPWQRYGEAMELLKTVPPHPGLIKFHPAPWATFEELGLVHDDIYIEQVVQRSLPTNHFRRIGFAAAEHCDLVASSFGVAGAAVAATRLALKSKARIVGCISGGTHHAHRAFGAGFCVFNDCALAAAIAVKEFGVQTVLVVDLDVHQGNGTAAIFEGDKRVYTFSMHQGKGYPMADRAVSDMDVDLPDGMGDDAYMDILSATLPKLIEELRPGLIVYQSGVDPLAGDVLGRLALSRRGLQRRNEAVFQCALAAAIPTVITFGGGYQRDRRVAVAAHADVYSQAAAMLQL